MLEASRSTDALEAFEGALDFNRTNGEALELAARQAYALSKRDRAILHLEALELVAEKSGDPVRRARAVRYRAEILKGGEPNEQVLGRDILSASIKTLRAADVENPYFKALELTLAYAELADLQVVRGRLWAARTALTRSKSCASNWQADIADEIWGRLKKIEGDLEQAERDKEKDNDRDGEDESGDDDRDS